MAPKEPTRHQLSSRLAYNSQTPSFLLKLQNKVAGRPTSDDEDEPQYLDGLDEFGRERRPPIPERPENDDVGSENEDDVEEKPMVVVLKEGKHLTEEEAENEKRQAKGLPPLSTQSKDATIPPDGSIVDPVSVSGSSKSSEPTGLSFSTKKIKENKSSTAKRKVPDGSDKFEETKQQPKKKPKKGKKELLSFDRDDLG